MTYLNGNGIWCLTSNSISTRLIASDPNIDFLIFDQEHSEHTFADLVSFQGIVSSFKKKIVIRIASNLQENILKAYEIFPDIVMIPGINNITEAKKSINFFNLPPHGSRGFSPYTYSHISQERGCDSKPKLFIQLENKELLKSLEDLIILNKLDGVFIGRYDLSKSLGIDIKSREMIELLKYISAKCKSKSITIGTLALTPEEKKELNNFFDFWTIGSDVSLIKEGLKKINLI